MGSFFGQVAGARSNIRQQQEQESAQKAAHDQAMRQKMLELALGESDKAQARQQTARTQTLAERRAELDAARQTAQEAAAARREELDNKRFGLQQQQANNQPPRNIDPLSPEGIRAQTALANAKGSGGSDGVGGQPAEGERKNAGFFERASQASPILQELDNTAAHTSFAEQYSSVLGNRAQARIAPSFQRYEQAKRQFKLAVLRKDTGASISANEDETTEQTYFTQPGDPPQLVEQKRQARIGALKELEIAGGRAIVRTAPQASQSPATVPFWQQVGIQPTRSR